MATPLFHGPITPITSLFTFSLLATVMPTLGSAWSSMGRISYLNLSFAGSYSANASSARPGSGSVPQPPGVPTGGW